jgi:hypothetical protein
VHAVSGYLHAIDGRLRVKVVEIKGSAEGAREVEHHLSMLTGVDRAAANPVTGNVLVLYDPRQRTAGDVLDALRALGYLSPVYQVAAVPPAQVVGMILLRATTEFALQRLMAALI